MDFISLLKLLPIDWIKQGITSKQAAILERQHIFVLDAIGSPAYCLVMAEGTSGVVSLQTIEIGIRNLQRSHPELAEECGIPDLDDPARMSRLKEILNGMVAAGKLRYVPPDRWRVV